ncbi:4-(cytidine 5'-diphospho)-2-C-methyl-D-erythritol kinase [Brevundimonas sp. A19_0]|uniref:4-(cytidine 5'-diphospho)-2-C-methyl-D-erythritol kinase n=1 Tax=Brevundimonas sp. A19_0 TaxID=2821087 RepID=UPI001AD981C5|nr:4-(cytidine 5'-diphospho)-2-C-methyl-D-erythritol kinase [Brevundimonas sp. A19_0]MBO9502216.1 4-(cytidine 5'-diphospho)-2-C-methyl-D-erythritol kinase [Brevundimonas sp. A19_0]
MQWHEAAPAKVNLFLHVGPVGDDGYHPLCSLVAFADVGDGLTLDPDGPPGLTVAGSFADALLEDPVGPGGNLVTKARDALQRMTGVDASGLSLTLDKRLPIAAGLGGGSSDAGAVLRLARRYLAPDMDMQVLAGVAAVLGADGPMCLAAVPSWAEGRGDVLTVEPRLPALHAVLVNPGVPSPTGAVYRAYDALARGEADRPAPPAAWDAATVMAWLAHQRNDLEGPAVLNAPAIGPALEALRLAGGARLVRMSGSGATVFGLYDDAADAARAARAIEADHPGWWVRATTLGAGPAA